VAGPSYAQRDSSLFATKVDPYQELAHDPRYAAFLKKMRLPYVNPLYSTDDNEQAF